MAKIDFCPTRTFEIAGSSLLMIPISGLARSLYKGAVLSRDVYVAYANERPFGTIL